MKFYHLFIVLILLTPIVSGLTGSIGNARAIVTITFNDEPIVLERTILVKNVNPESVKIKLDVKDELEKLVEIIDKEFILLPNEEKKALYKVKIDRLGVFRGQIIVFFESLVMKGPGVAIPSTLVLRVQDEDGFIPPDNNLSSIDKNAEPENNDVTGSVINSDSIENNYGRYIFFGLMSITVICVVLYFVKKLK